MPSKKADLSDGYIKIANQIVDRMMVVNLSAYETRVLMCIFRKTYGWNKKNDWIANSQIVSCTGIHKAHVSRTISKLLKRKIVTSTGNRVGINTNTSSWLPKRVTRRKLPKRVTPVTSTGNKKLPKRADTKDNKDTIQKTGSRFEKTMALLTDKHVESYMERYKVGSPFIRAVWEKMVRSRLSRNKPYKNWHLAFHNWITPELEKKNGRGDASYTEDDIKNMIGRVHGRT